MYQIPDLVRKMVLGQPIAHVQRQQHGRVVVVFPETGRHQFDLPVISRPFYHTAGPIGIPERGRRAKKFAVVGDFLRRRLLGSGSVRSGVAAEAVSVRLSAPGAQFAPARRRDAAQCGSDVAVPEGVSELQDDCGFSQEQCNGTPEGQSGVRAAVPRVGVAGRQPGSG